MQKNTQMEKKILFASGQIVAASYSQACHHFTVMWQAGRIAHAAHSERCVKASSPSTCNRNRHGNSTRPEFTASATGITGEGEDIDDKSACSVMLEPTNPLRAVLRLILRRGTGTHAEDRFTWLFGNRYATAGA